MAEGDPQKHPSFPEDKTEPREANQMATALSMGATERHAHLTPPQKCHTSLTPACPGAGGQGVHPPQGHAGRQRSGADRGQRVGRTLPVQCFLHPQLQLLLRRQLRLGKGEKRRERGWVSRAPTTHLSQEPGTYGGTWGGGTGRRCPPAGVWEAWGQLEPRWTGRRGGGHRT